MGNSNYDFRDASNNELIEITNPALDTWVTFKSSYTQGAGVGLRFFAVIPENDTLYITNVKIYKQ